MMSDDQPAAVRAGEELDLVKLNAYLVQHPELGTVREQWQFPGGYSNLTFLLRTTSGKEFILRRPPRGAAIKSAHDMGREYTILSLLRPHYAKIPNPLCYCEDASILGAPFYLMERISGTILRPSSVNSIQVPATEMRTIAEALVDNLVALHSINIHTTGLVQLGKPEGYVRRQVEGWTKRYSAAQTDPIESIEALSLWLNQHLPDEQPATLLHNDYKYDNLVLDTNNLSTIIGVLDWEMATVGDPWMDLGASLAYWAEAGEDELAKVFNVSWLPGNLTRQEVFERYAEKSGRIIASPVFYYVFGLFKNAVIAQQIYARWKQGHSKDPRFGQLIHVIRNLGTRGLRALESNSL